MESKKSIDFPSLFQNNETNNQDKKSDGSNKEKNCVPILETDSAKTKIPSLFSNEILNSSSSSYSLKNYLQSKLLKLKRVKQSESKDDNKLLTLYSKKNDITDDSMSKVRKLEIDNTTINSSLRSNNMLSQGYTLQEHLNIHTRIKKLKEENTENVENSINEAFKENDTTSNNSSGNYYDDLVSSISETTNTKTSTDSLENKLLSSGFLAAYETQASLPLKEYKKVDESKITKAIRNKACRSTLQGYDCQCCSGYYDALQLKTPEKLQRINEVSRHRGINSQCDKTPEGYWDKNFLKKSEQRKRGFFIESNSPIKNKKYKKKLKFSNEIEETKVNPE